MKDVFSTTILALIAAAVLVGAWSLTEEKEVFVAKTTTPRVPIDIRAVADRVLDSQVVGEGADAVVRFAYIGERVSEKLDPEEVLWMRTPSSWTINRTTKDDFESGNYALESIFYPQQTFIERPDGWHIIEHGEAPKKQFDQAFRFTKYFSYLIPTAQADGPKYSGAGDGYITGGGLGVSWATAHAATSGTAEAIGDQALVGSGVTSGKFGGSTIYRSFFPFDTSGIPQTATITSASLNVYADYGAGSQSITVVQTSQATHTTLAAEDYDQCGAVTSPTEGIDSGTRPVISSLSLVSYTVMPLNSTGRGWIKKSGQASNCSATAGITCLGIRDLYDTSNSEPPTDNGVQANFATSERTGTSKDPFLQIAYTMPQSVLEGGLWMRGGGGKLNIVGGGVKVF